MHYGVSYYPEQKSPEELEHDLGLLVASGIDVVRMGEFAWCRMEKREGEFDFSWLATVVDRLGKERIHSILCTPTACPPVWMVEKFPDMAYVDNRGRRRPFGGRRHYCYSHEGYREKSAVIAQEMGKRFGEHPWVLGFQIDNEPAQESTGRCRCPLCRQKFQGWLGAKYGDIDSLNRRMGTVFWGQEYSRFDQIHPPLNGIEVGTDEPIYAYYDNPSLRLDFERFSSDAQIEYQNVQLKALRKHSEKPVTTNGTGLATNSIDYYRSFAPLDVYAFDSYPNLREGVVSSYPYAFARGVKNRDFWLAEFSSGGGHGLRGTGRLQASPGSVDHRKLQGTRGGLELSVVHAAAAGASLLCHFQFRAFPYGAEQLNYAIVDADGIPRRMFKELAKTAEELGAIAPVLERGRVSNDIAMVFDYDSHWALNIKPVQIESFDDITFSQGIHDQLAFRGYGLDMISRNADFQDYRFIILPALMVVSTDLEKKIRDYVRGGGIVLATFLSSVKNEDNAGKTQSLPGGLADVFGIAAKEVEPVFESTRETVAFTDGSRRKTLHWAEVLELHGAESLASYDESYKLGSSALTHNRFGQGRAYYLGTGFASDELAETLIAIFQEESIDPLPFSWEGRLECLKREHPDGTDYFLFNFENQEKVVHLEHSMVDGRSGLPGVGSINIPGRSWKLFCATGLE